MGTSSSADWSKAAQIDYVAKDRRKVGQQVAGTAQRSAIGFRSGDHIQGVISNKASGQIQIITNWNGIAYLAKVFDYGNGRFGILCVVYGFFYFIFEVFLIIDVTTRRSPKGKKAVPPITLEEYFARGNRQREQNARKREARKHQPVSRAQIHRPIAQQAAYAA